MANQSPSTCSKTCLPGFGIPLGTFPDWSIGTYPNALNSRFEALITTQREFTMLMIMDRITDKICWEEKVFNEEIVNQWRSELVNHDEDSNNDEDSNDDESSNEEENNEVEEWERREITNEMVDWCFAELKYKAELLKKFDCVETLDGIFKSDTTISNDLREALIKAAAPLENVPARAKDWHPGSGEQVLDLIHPSMYPLVYGQSRILVDEIMGLDDCIRRCGDGETLSIPSTVFESASPCAVWSRKFQWLPSEVEIPAGGQDVQIMSYINNLHPQTHKNLYSVVELLVAKVIPLWNQTLKPLKTRHRVPLRVQMKGDGYEYYGDARKIVHPQPEQFKPPGQRFNEKYEKIKYENLPSVDLREEFGRLQIIVKLASIYLTPEKPSYEGGSWHVEGQLNESICATALYYYETENLSQSLLSFRRLVDPDEKITYEHGCCQAVEKIYGISSEGPSIQDIGDVVTKEGRLLTFPNTIHHRVAPFRLSDPTKPGHRKILAFFLIDPHRRIISTANVPCQQKDIWADQVRNVEPLSSIPVELAEKVINYATGFPVSLDVAKEQRLELMEERSMFVEDQNNYWQWNYNFSLCEH